MYIGLRLCVVCVYVCVCALARVCVCVCVCTWQEGRAQYTNKHHMLPHTPSPPPMAPYTLPPSLPHSPKRRELVKDARRQHADRVAVQVEGSGHETRRQSALTHSTTTCPLCPSACTCMCPMHMRHAHARVHRGSLSVCACAHRACVCACACASSHEYNIPM